MPNMHIFFDLDLDGGHWPDLLTAREAVMGRAILGPQGLLALLQTMLGLGHREVPQAVRISQQLERMRALDDGRLWYSASFQTDPWASARTLLSWRDELVLHGWRPELDQGGLERLETLARLESLEHPLARGTADHLRLLIARLGEVDTLDLDTLQLGTPRDLLPAPWRELLNRLETLGTRILAPVMEKAPTLPAVTLLESDDEWSCACTVAAWLATSTDLLEERPASTAGDNHEVVLLCQGETTALDHRLHRLGLPAPGQTTASSQRDLLQLLPLAIDNLWKPVRPGKLLELLSLPCSPVPRFAARELIRALSDEPGLGGERWREALARIAGKHADYLERKGQGRRQAEDQGRRLADDLDNWLHTSRQGADSDNTVQAVLGIIARVRKALGRYRTKTPLAAIALGHCRVLADVIGSLASLDRPLLSRILDEILARGSVGPAFREAAPWGVIRAPGQLLDRTGTLIWWPFVDPGNQREWIWSNDELAQLAQHDCQPESPGHQRRREAWQLDRLLELSQNLLLVLPHRLDGEAVRHHPLLDLLKMRPGVEIDTVDAYSFLGQKGPALAGRRPWLAEIEATHIIPAREPVRHIAPGSLADPASLSPTRLATLFGCPFHWLAEQYGIEPGGLPELPSGNLLIGTLAHKVLEELFRQRPRWDPDEAASSADELFDRYVPELACELLLPENDLARRRAQWLVKASAADLAVRLSALDIHTVSPEQWLETRLDDIPLRGRADLIATGKDGHDLIIDFKFSWRLGHYQESIEQGTDIQLIAYARMLDPVKLTPVAYYLIPRRELVTIFGEFGVQVCKSENDLDSAWTRLHDSWRLSRERLRAGRVTVAGLDDPTPAEDDAPGNLIRLDPPCDYCPHINLCGLRGATHLE